MKNLNVVYYQAGENRGTWSPKCELCNFTGDLNEKTFRFVMADWDVKTEVDMYKVKTVRIPNGWDYSTFIRNYTNYTFAYNICGETALDSLTNEQLNSLMQLGNYEWYILGQLSEKMAKSNFLASLYSQFTNWLSIQGEKYNKPFSQRQYEALAKFRIRSYDAQREAQNIYNKFDYL
jgi:hypothetical protein